MSPPHAILAVDGGATKTEAELRRPDGTVLARHRAGPCNLYQDPDGGLAAIAACWTACAAEAGLDPIAGPPKIWISAGLAGLSAPGTAERYYQAHRGFGRALLSSDGYTAAVSAFGDQPGALMAIGTGVVGCRFDAQGRFSQVGGWGFPAGDRGGGAWLGLNLVSAWLEDRDGIGGPALSPSLCTALQAQTGCDRAAILGWLRTATPGQFAALVPLLLHEAKLGTTAAVSLLQDAGTHLARLAAALVGPDDLEVGLSGGLAEPLAPWLSRALAATGQTMQLRGGLSATSVEGAWRIAVGLRPAQFTEGA